MKEFKFYLTGGEAVVVIARNIKAAVSYLTDEQSEVVSTVYTSDNVIIAV